MVVRGRGMLEARLKRGSLALAPDVVAGDGGLLAVQDDQVMAVAAMDRLRGGSPRLLVPVLAVNDRREAVDGVALYVLPDVQDRTAGRVDECAPALDQLLEELDGDAECRQDDHVVWCERINRFAWIGEEADTLCAKLLVDVRIVDDLARQQHRAIGKPLARLICVVDCAVDAVAEPELPREVNGQPASGVAVIVVLDRGDDIAVVALGQRPGDLLLEVETFTEYQGGHL
jgi:hypothetical protein